MKIQFEQNHSRNVDKVTTKYMGTPSPKTEKTGAFALDISGMVMDNTAYEVHGRTAEEVMQAAGNVDVTLLRNYMTVMSHSMSKEDFARLQKEGCHPTDTEIETVVTIVDKIKAELAKAGVDVQGYTDTLDIDTLAEIAGSENFARAITTALHQADVPVTEQNVKDVTAAAQQAKSLEVPSPGVEKYMIANHMEPTVENFYKAEYSGAGDRKRRPGGYFAEELPGYYGRQSEQGPADLPRELLEKIILQAGYEITEETLENAAFFIEQGIPLSPENLVALEKIRQSQIPMEEAELLQAIAGAIAEGKRAGQANLYDGRSIYEKAADIDAEIDRLLGEAKEAGAVSQRRQLEEIRLRMTVEANVKLLKSGFSIDTSHMEELVDALKQLEEREAFRLFGQGSHPPADYELYRQTLEKTAEIPYMPAAVIGRVLMEGSGEVSLYTVHERGKALQAAYEEAGQRYEALRTEPRRDLGDKIEAAFQNIDDILEDLEMEKIEINRRAIRILGYNGMDIATENITAVKRADHALQRVLDIMTPAAVVKMIRDGVNPLETGMEELEQYLSGQETYESEAVKYSRYLYNLEQNREITSEEKEAYIGIYRMLRQIEKTDGAALGSLLNSGKEINFTNLLSAVRTVKAKGVDVAVTEDFGGLQKLSSGGDSITDQIAMGYTSGLTDAWTSSAQDQSYDEILWKEVQSMGHTEESVLPLLKKYELPATMDYILALTGMGKERGSALRKLWEKRESMETIPGSLEAMGNWEDILENRETAQESYGTYMEELMEAAREHTFSGAETSVDVRSMQLLHKQLYVMQQASYQEEYDIPVLLEGEMTAIHLTLRHSEAGKGRVEISMDNMKAGKISAQLELEGKRLKGFLSGETSEARELLEKLGESFAQTVREYGFETDQIPVAQGRVHFRPEAEGERQVETEHLYQVAKLFITTIKQKGYVNIEADM